MKWVYLSPGLELEPRGKLHLTGRPGRRWLQEERRSDRADERSVVDTVGQVEHVGAKRRLPLALPRAPRIGARERVALARIAGGLLGLGRDARRPRARTSAPIEQIIGSSQVRSPFMNPCDQAAIVAVAA